MRSYYRIFLRRWTLKSVCRFLARSAKHNGRESNPEEKKLIKAVVSSKEYR